MDETPGIWSMEQEFWGAGVDFYRDHLAPDAKMLFPEPVGMLNRDEVIRSIDESPRWTRVEMEERSRVSLHPEVELLAYRARAWREGDTEVYQAWIVSVYRALEDSWLLVYHQQVPTP